MSNLIIKRNGSEIPFKSFVFPSGEVGVKLDVKNSVAFVAKTGVYQLVPYQTIIARIQNSNDILELMNLVDALRRIDATPINLFLTKIPYAQQDRVCDAGESFSLKVFANLINSLNFNRVTVIDPHSNVCDGVLNNLEIISQFEVVNKWTDFIGRVLSGVRFLSPDAGSNKKVFEIAKFFGQDFIRADKLRDLSNGDIKETIVYCEDLNKQDVCILDDICLGGRTFTEIAKALKTKNVGKIILFVTHGVFNKGTDELFNNGIDEIWTTNSFRKDLTETDKLRILDVDKFINY